LDGIPLAIELAAARVKVLSAEQIASRLDDRFRLLTGGSRTAFPRHQTLHALIDWSYGLLSEPERMLFRCLSVFRGGWRLEASEAVCPCGGQAEIEVLDLLVGLVNKSLVSIEIKDGEVQRYRMLETIRQYSHEKLVEAGEVVQMCNRHLEYFATYAEFMEKKLRSSTYLDALEHLDTEIDNHRAALAWAFGGGGTQRSWQNVKITDGLRLANALGRYWMNRGLFQEGHDWLRKALAMPVDVGRMLSLRAWAYIHAGILSNEVGSQSTAQQLFGESVILFRQSDNRPGLALALIQYGKMLADVYPSIPHPVNYASGIAHIEEGIAIIEELGDISNLGEAFIAKAYIAYTHKDYKTQQTMLKKSIACFEKAGDFLTTEYLKGSLAWNALYQGDYETARRLYEYYLEFCRKVNNKIEIAHVLQWLGLIAIFRKNLTQAENCFQEDMYIFKEIGILGGVVWVLRWIGGINYYQGHVTRAKELFLESQSLGHTLHYDDRYGDPGGNLEFVLWMGVIAKNLGQITLAARFLGAVEAVEETFFQHSHPYSYWLHEQITGKERSALDGVTFAAAWTEGRKLTLEQVLEEALDFCHQNMPP